MRRVHVYLFLVLLVVALFISGCSGKLCPPAGFPQPPGCGESQVKEDSQEDGKQIEPFFQVKQPKYTGERGSFVFPPSCDLIPDKIGKLLCADYKKGAMIFWKEEACIAMPFESGNKACTSEREFLKKEGEKKIAELRKQNSDFLSKPYQNVYVYGDIRLKTEEMQPNVRMWGGPTFNGWRDDEIYMSHAAGIFDMATHSFGYIGQNDFNYMRNQLIEEAGIKITSPDDLKKPEVVKINSDDSYLEEKSDIFKKVKEGASRDFDNNLIRNIYTFPDGSTMYVNLIMNPINPIYQDYLIQFYKWQVDYDADGIFIDDLGGHDANSAFDDYNMNLFASWLDSNADKQKLSDLGINDLKAFNYRTFLKEKDYTKEVIDAKLGKVDDGTWKQIPLAFEFKKFLREKNRQAIIRIITEVKEYARQTGRNIAVAGNSGELSPAVAFLRKYMDNMVFEHGYFVGLDPLKYNTVVPYSKLANAREVPVSHQVVSPQWKILTGLKNKQLSYDLLKLGAMEAYAAKSSAHYVRYTTLAESADTQDPATVYSRFEDRSDMKEMMKAYGFMRKFKEYFGDDFSSAAKVGIMYDNDYVENEAANLQANQQYGVERVGRLLYFAGIDYDVINFNQIDLNKYKIILLPYFKEMSSEQLNKIKQAKQAGVNIIAFDAFPAELNDIAVKSDEQAVLSEVKKDQSIQTLQLPEKMTSVIAKSSKGDYVAHIFNFEYTLDGFKLKSNITFNNIFGKDYRFYYASLENPELKELDKDNPVLPDIKTYGMLVVKI